MLHMQLRVYPAYTTYHCVMLYSFYLDFSLSVTRLKYIKSDNIMLTQTIKYFFREIPTLSLTQTIAI